MPARSLALISARLTSASPVCAGVSPACLAPAHSVLAAAADADTPWGATGAGWFAVCVEAMGNSRSERMLVCCALVGRLVPLRRSVPPHRCRRRPRWRPISRRGLRLAGFVFESGRRRGAGVRALPSRAARLLHHIRDLMREQRVAGGCARAVFSAASLVWPHVARRRLDAERASPQRRDHIECRAVGLLLHGAVRLAFGEHRLLAGAMSALLDYVRQLVRDQPIAQGLARMILACSERNVRAQRKRARVQARPCGEGAELHQGGGREWTRTIAEWFEPGDGARPRLQEGAPRLAGFYCERSNLRHRAEELSCAVPGLVAR